MYSVGAPNGSCQNDIFCIVLKYKAIDRWSNPMANCQMGICAQWRCHQLDIIYELVRVVVWVVIRNLSFGGSCSWHDRFLQKWKPYLKQDAIARWVLKIQYHFKSMICATQFYQFSTNRKRMPRRFTSKERHFSNLWMRFCTVWCHIGEAGDRTEAFKQCGLECTKVFFGCT